MKMHFTIVNDPEWFNFGLNEPELETLRKGLRSRLAHQGYMDTNLILCKGDYSDSAVKTDEHGRVVMNLVPFFEKTKICVEKFVKSLELEIII